MLFYEIMLALSIVLSVIYVFIWHKHFDITLTMLFTLIPITCLGYVMFAGSATLAEALNAKKIMYLSGTFLQYFLMLSIMNLCGIKLGKWLKRLLFVYCCVIYGFVLTIGHAPYFYKDAVYSVEKGYVTLTCTYGIMHTVFLIMTAAFFAASLSAIAYSYFQKKQVSRRILFMLVLPDLLCMLCYFIGKPFVTRIELVEPAYVFAQFMYLLIAYRLSLYDVNDTAIDSMVQNGETGFISFDLRHRYLGSNEAAKHILPSLHELAVDEMLGTGLTAGKVITPWLKDFEADNTKHAFSYTVSATDSEADDRIYAVEVSDLYDEERKCGYMVKLTDDTQNRKYIRLLDHYNEDLQKTVQEKTQHIVEMHDNLIMSLAAMVESRDNSTGGHIRRTSVGVRILIDEIRKAGDMQLSEEFCKNIIKAAPMHDLGKIAVDDAVLRKPGRFTAEEFEKMKHHAAEGARVIHEILKKTDDAAFREIAENVAHYHHERWDGSGYPEGLKGEQIPLEARIMAIADVYDALVSKRVYKDSMSFEKADEIILSGMGTQFDAGLEQYYLLARPRLETFYSSIEY